MPADLNENMIEMLVYEKEFIVDCNVTFSMRNKLNNVIKVEPF